MTLPALSALPLPPTGAFGSHCDARHHAKCVRIAPAKSLFRGNPDETTRLCINQESTSVLLPVPVGHAETLKTPYDTLYESDWWRLVTRGVGIELEVVLGSWNGHAWVSLPSGRSGIRGHDKLTWRAAYEAGFFPRDRSESGPLQLVLRLRQKHQQYTYATILSMHIANAAVHAQELREARVAGVDGLEFLDEDPPPSRRQRLSLDQVEDFLFGAPAAPQPQPEVASPEV